jgi:RND superfamily putative drug exporter
VVGIWLALTLFGMFAAGQVADRWLQTFSIPGNEAYEANQRAAAALGNGEFQPFVAVLRTTGDRDVTEIAGVQESIARATAALPGARSTSYFNTKSDLFVSSDRRLTYALIYAPGKPGFGVVPDKPVREALAASAPAGVTANVTGTLPLYADASGGDTAGPSVLVEALIGGLGALIILLFTFGTLPAVVLPLMVAVASIFQTFTLVWLLTYLTDVSIIVQFLIALVGLGVAIDYSLLMIFRFREEIRHGADNESAVRETMRHAGHSVIVSGTTVAVGLLSMIIIPLPFIRSIGIGGMLIPAVSVLAAITLLPAMLFTLGPRIYRLSGGRAPPPGDHRNHRHRDRRRPRLLRAADEPERCAVQRPAGRGRRAFGLHGAGRCQRHAGCDEALLRRRRRPGGPRRPRTARQTHRSNRRRHRRSPRGECGQG